MANYACARCGVRANSKCVRCRTVFIEHADIPCAGALNMIYDGSRKPAPTAGWEVIELSIVAPAGTLTFDEAIARLAELAAEVNVNALFCSHEWVLEDPACELGCCRRT